MHCTSWKRAQSKNKLLTKNFDMFVQNAASTMQKVNKATYENVNKIKLKKIIRFEYLSTKLLHIHCPHTHINTHMETIEIV
jgi:hypothetical protein